jgi:hypothetical protein
VAKKPYPTLKGIQFLLDEVAAKMPNAKSAKPEQFVDLSLLQQLEKEGFFAEMAKRYPWSPPLVVIKSRGDKRSWI